MPLYSCLEYYREYYFFGTGMVYGYRYTDIMTSRTSCFIPGMAAISSTLLGICSHGDHIVSSGSVYGGTFSLMKDFLATKCGISTSFVAINDLKGVEAAITSKTKVSDEL